MNSANKKQVGGNHYIKLKIQPMDYSEDNGLSPAQHTAIKYVTRFKDKDGKKDLLKARHLIDWMINKYYPEEELKKREPIKIPREHADFFRESGLIK